MAPARTAACHATMNRRPPILRFVSLVLLLATAVPWALSYARPRTFDCRLGSGRVAIASDSGRLAVGYASGPLLAGAPGQEVRWLWPASLASPPPGGSPPGVGSALGFARGTVAVGRTVPVLGDLPLLGAVFTNAAQGDYVQVPWWLLFAPAAVSPCLALAAAMRQRLRRRRRRGRSLLGLCPSCGYDLRATPGRCPECGSIAAVPPVT